MSSHDEQFRTGEYYWEKDSIKFRITRRKCYVTSGLKIRSISGEPLLQQYFCGYCKFPFRFLREPGKQGLIAMVPIHGGITFVEEYPDGSIEYGFDCNHAKDIEDPSWQTTENFIQECEKMARYLILAAQFEDQFHLASTAKEFIEVGRCYIKAILKDKTVRTKLLSNFAVPLNTIMV